MPSTPTIVSSEVTHLAHRLLQRLGDVVGVVGGPAEHLAALLLVEVAQRQPGQLRLDLPRAAGRPAAARRPWRAGPGAGRTARRRRRATSTEQQHPAERGRSRCPARARRSSRTACRRSVPLPLARSRVDRLRPWSRRPAAAGRSTPAKMRSVAWPRIFGPSTDSATLATPKASTSHDERPARAAACRSSRLAGALEVQATSRPACRRPSSRHGRSRGGTGRAGRPPAARRCLWARSCRRLLLGQLGQHDLAVRLVGRPSVRCGCRCRRPRPRRARRCGRRRGWC